MPDKETREPINNLTKKSNSLDNLNFDALKVLFKPHIESFDHLIEAGMETIFKSIKLVVVHPTTFQKLIITLEAPKLLSPQKDGIAKTTRKTLYPFECRQAKLTYSGRFTADVCFKYDDGGAILRENFNFGQFPIMLQSKRCNLRDFPPRKLVSYKEEASEMGGYFIVNGLERCIRPIILPKRNYPMSTVRSSFSERREGYTDKAVVIRCVRADQTSLTVKLYHLRNGSARLGFWIHGREYMLPVGILLKALIDTTDREIYANLTSCYNEKYEKGKGVVGTQLVGERAKIILDEESISNLLCMNSEMKVIILSLMLF